MEVERTVPRGEEKVTFNDTFSSPPPDTPFHPFNNTVFNVTFVKRLKCHIREKVELNVVLLEG